MKKSFTLKDVFEVAVKEIPEIYSDQIEGKCIACNSVLELVEVALKRRANIDEIQKELHSEIRSINTVLDTTENMLLLQLINSCSSFDKLQADFREMKRSITSNTGISLKVRKRVAKIELEDIFEILVRGSLWAKIKMIWSFSWTLFLLSRIASDKKVGFPITAKYWVSLIKATLYLSIWKSTILKQKITRVEIIQYTGLFVDDLLELIAKEKLLQIYKRVLEDISNTGGYVDMIIPYRLDSKFEIKLQYQLVQANSPERIPIIKGLSDQSFVKFISFLYKEDNNSGSPFLSEAEVNEITSAGATYSKSPPRLYNLNLRNGKSRAVVSNCFYLFTLEHAGKDTKQGVAEFLKHTFTDYAEMDVNTIKNELRSRNFNSINFKVKGKYL